MSGGIYLIQSDDKLVELTEQPPLKMLKEQSALETFLETFDWVVREIQEG